MFRSNQVCPTNVHVARCQRHAKNQKLLYLIELSGYRPLIIEIEHRVVVVDFFL